MNGASAPVAEWSDSRIVAYAPEGSNLGGASVRVLNSHGQSNAVSLTINARTLGSGPVRWTFAASAPRVMIRPEAGPDGTIYVGDLYGHLYALSPTGGLKWIVRNANVGTGAISTDASGNIYTGGEQVLNSYDKNGNHRWTFTHGAQLEAGPNVGPNGLIYAATRSGYGAMILSPSGQLLWSDNRVTATGNSSPSARRISFSGGNWTFVVNPAFYGSISTTWSFSIDGDLAWWQPQGLNGTAGAPDGSTLVTASIDSNQLNSFWEDGSLKWSVPFSMIGRATNTPSVASNGNVYLINQRTLVSAISASGQLLWSDQMYVNFDVPCRLATRPDGKRILAEAAPSLGLPTVATLYKSNGQRLWSTELPFIDGGPITFMSDIGFTKDQGTAVVGTSHNEYAPDPVSFVYGFNTFVPPTIAPGPVRWP